MTRNDSHEVGRIRVFSKIFLPLLLPIVLCAQTESQILSYNVAASVNERTSEIAGNIIVRIRVVSDSQTKYSFLVPKEWNIESVRDANNDSFDSERGQSERINFYSLTLELPRMFRRDDSLLINIEFNANFDTSSSLTMFVNQKEFVLPFTEITSWLPQFGAATTERFSLELKTPPQFTVIAEEKFDTTFSEGMRIWKRSASNPMLLSSAFTLCGLQNAVEQTSLSSDSLVAVSFFSTSSRFNQQYAAGVTRQMNDALKFFYTLTKQPLRPMQLTYAIIGDEQFNINIINTNRFIIHRNSPAHIVFDSSALTKTIRNKWLMNIARQCCLPTNDSTALFDDGFASYLAMRFLSSTFPQIEKQERFDAISNALTFFPSGTIAAGRTSKATTNEMLSFKGRYIFLMLEYILGREPFERVIAKMFKRFSATQISFKNFQQLCEEEYGSSLDWFFNQWLYRNTAPEFVLQWKSEKTPRGISVVKALIEQRGDLFSMPIPLVFSFGSRTMTKRIVVEQAKQEFTFTFPSSPTNAELDPKHNIFRWLLEIRIFAHARSAQLFLNINRDLNNAEHEAQYTLQLDPNNSTGSAPLVLFVLGKISVINNDLEKAKEYFLKAMQSFATEETELYKLLSLARYANIVEMEGKRDEAVALYQRAVAEGRKNPLIFEQAIIEAEKYLREKFISSDTVWFGIN